jgi:hypothetical protein
MHASVSFATDKSDGERIGSDRFGSVDSAVPAFHRAAIAADRSFVIEIREAMIGELLDGHFARDGKSRQTPRPQHTVDFEHEIPVQGRVVVLEDDEAEHGSHGDVLIERPSTKFCFVGRVSDPSLGISAAPPWISAPQDGSETRPTTHCVGDLVRIEHFQTIILISFGESTP